MNHIVGVPGLFRVFKAKLVSGCVLLLVTHTCMGRDLKSVENWKALTLEGYCRHPRVYAAILDTVSSDFGKGGLNLSEDADLEKVMEYIEVRDAWLVMENQNNFGASLLLTQLLNILLLDEAYFAIKEGRPIRLLEGARLLPSIRLEPEVVLRNFDRHSWPDHRSLKNPLSFVKGDTIVFDGWRKYVRSYGLQYEKYGEMLFLRVPDENAASLYVADVCEYMVKVRPTWVLQRIAFILDQQRNLARLYECPEAFSGGKHVLADLNTCLNKQIVTARGGELYMGTDVPDYSYHPIIFAADWRAKYLLNFECLGPDPDCE